MPTPESNQEKNQVETTEQQQKQDAIATQIDETELHKTEAEERARIEQLTKQMEEMNKELAGAKKRISKLNEDDKSKRFKIVELKDVMKSFEEREASLKNEIDALKQQTSNKDKSFEDKEKELNALKSKLEAIEKEKETATNEVLKQEEARKAELVKQAEIASKKQNDPDILKLVQSAPDNATRELILNKLKPKKVDTVKVTELSSIFSKEDKKIDIFKDSLSDLSALKEDDPMLYDDILSKAGNLRYK